MQIKANDGLSIYDAIQNLDVIIIFRWPLITLSQLIMRPAVPYLSFASAYLVRRGGWDC
jgi:hypothetical protein